MCVRSRIALYAFATVSQLWLSLYCLLLCYGHDYVESEFFVFCLPFFGWHFVGGGCVFVGRLIRVTVSGNNDDPSHEIHEKWLSDAQHIWNSIGSIIRIFYSMHIYLCCIEYVYSVYWKKMSGRWAIVIFVEETKQICYIYHKIANLKSGSFSYVMCQAEENVHKLNTLLSATTIVFGIVCGLRIHANIPQ